MTDPYRDEAIGTLVFCLVVWIILTAALCGIALVTILVLFGSK